MPTKLLNRSLHVAKTTRQDEPYDFAHNFETLGLKKPITSCYKL